MRTHRSLRTGRSSRAGRAPAIDPAALEKAALAYLARYACSAETLSRVLLRRVERAVRAGLDELRLGEREQGRARVAALVLRLVDAGLVDDLAFALGRARRLQRQGRPLAAIRHALAAKGVGGPEIATALEYLTQEGAEPDLRAALAFAKRRRLGPFRPRAERAAAYRRDLAAFARARFSLALARRVLDAPTPEALRAELAAPGGTGGN